MSRLIIGAARRFGRFAVLLFVIPAVGVFALWLQLFDIHKGWFVGTAFIAIPLLAMAVAFLVSTLLAGFQRSKVKKLTKVEAPGLWELWNSIAGSRRAARTSIVLDDVLNASVREERSLVPFFGRRIILTIGIPLLAVTDQNAVAAILAHENAHVINQDTNGNLKLAEFENTFEYIFAYADPQTTISGGLLYAALGWLSEPFRKEIARLSRESELEADHQSAKHGNSMQAGRALLLVAAASNFLNEVIYEPLKHQLMGAAVPPRPPLDRIFEVIEQLADPAVLADYVGRAWQEPADPNGSHPSYAERLSALGYEKLPTVAPISEQALSTLLTKETAKQYIVDLDMAWTNRVANALQ